MFHVSSWYDIFLEGAAQCLPGHRQARAAAKRPRRNQKLLIGPWAHLRPFTEPTTGGAGNIDFGSEAAIELHDICCAGTATGSRGEETGIMDDPPVRLFVMGDNKWRDENEWPWLAPSTPAGTFTREAVPTPAAATARCPPCRLNRTSRADQFTYDPNDPAPTLGGNTLIIEYGVFDQGPAEDRPDVLSFTSDPWSRIWRLPAPFQ